MLRFCARNWTTCVTRNRVTTTFYKHVKSTKYLQKLTHSEHYSEFHHFVKHSFCTSKYRTPKIYEGTLKTMKLDTPEFHSLFTPELNTLIGLFKKYGYEIRIAGGPVRDLLCGKLPHDIDLATTATPDQMKEMFELEKVRMINAKGESHGTITARINDKENYEVTTLRIDLRTDGRHAEVQFTKDWRLDANRRDLTVNSMFLDFEGTVYDYFNGQEDLKNKRVCFVGNPEDRIQEDYLRILRYFRFYGRIAEKPNDHEEVTLTAVRENCAGLAGISGERLWVEMKKILSGNHACSLFKTMLKLGLGQYLGLPAECNIEEFELACQRSEGLDPLPMTRVAGLLATDDEVYELNKRLKMSSEELKTGLFILNYRDLGDSEDDLKYYQYLLIDVVAQEKKAKNRIIELLKYKGKRTLLEEFEAWEVPKFPVSGSHLIQRNIKKGPVFKKVLDEMRQIWKRSDFKLTAEEILEESDELVKKFTSK